MKKQKVLIACLAIATAIAVILLIWHPWSPNDNAGAAGDTAQTVRETVEEAAGEIAGS